MTGKKRSGEGTKNDWWHETDPIDRPLGLLKGHPSAIGGI
jgi:hypothetical protein